MLHKLWQGMIGDALGIVQEIRIWLVWQMVYVQSKSCSRKWDAWNSLELSDRSRLPNPRQKTRLCSLVGKRKGTYHLVKIKENENIDKFLDLISVEKAVEYEGDGDTICS